MRGHAERVVDHLYKRIIEAFGVLFVGALLIVLTSRLLWHSRLQEEALAAGFPQSRACGTAWPESRSSEVPNPEVDAVLGHLAPPYQLVGTLLYGCGLRLSECLELRIQRFNLDGGS